MTSSWGLSQSWGLSSSILGHFGGRSRRVEEKAKQDFVTRLCDAGLLACVAIACFVNLRHALSDDEDGPLAITNTQLGALAVVLTLGMLHQRIWGMTLMFKINFPLGVTCVGLFIALTSRPLDSWHMLMILVFDFVAIVQSDGDEVALHQLAIILMMMYVVYVIFHVFAIDGMGPQIHMVDYGNDYDLLNQLFCNIAPVLLNGLLVVSYSRDQRRESQRARTSVELASQVAKALSDFDLEGAQSLLQECSESEELPVCTQLWQLIHNLRVYRPFLPNYLFPQNVENDSDPTHGAVSKAMWGKPTCWDSAETAAIRLRDPEYSLIDFHSDVGAAFPELQLYNSDESRFSSGRTNTEEYQRTLGALYSVYCIARLDMDGKEIFSFGVDPQGKPVGAEAACGCDPDDKRYMFYKYMDWDRMLELFIRAGLLVRRPQKAVASSPSPASTPTRAPTASLASTPRTPGAELHQLTNNSTTTLTKMSTGVQVEKTRPRVDVERMTAFLALTAIHDVMKNSSLLPTVHEEHAPYQGIAKGDQINDHDLALMYIMEHFPGLLPSFHGLGPAQRAAVFFTQGKMGFNNGWLVQGEAPPGALFSRFRQVITLGGASDSDISFYFSHWLTDLAGAEPFGERPWPGSEKFALRFPLKVLNAFLDSFTYVHRLSIFSEVQVMENYLQGRWAALGMKGDAPEGCAVASMRVALMAQGFETAAVAALEGMPPQERRVLAAELARTGLQAQFDGAPAEVSERPAGPALLVYYAPALIQTAGAQHVDGALLVLAALCRAARELFPLEATPQAVGSTVVIRIDALKALTPPEIGAGGPWFVQRTSSVDAVVAAGEGPGESDDDVGARVAIELPELR